MLDFIPYETMKRRVDPKIIENILQEETFCYIEKLIKQKRILIRIYTHLVYEFHNNSSGS